MLADYLSTFHSKKALVHLKICTGCYYYNYLKLPSSHGLAAVQITTLQIDTQVLLNTSWYTTEHWSRVCLEHGLRGLVTGEPHYHRTSPAAPNSNLKEHHRCEMPIPTNALRDVLKVFTKGGEDILYFL